MNEMRKLMETVSNLLEESKMIHIVGVTWDNRDFAAGLTADFLSRWIDSVEGGDDGENLNLRHEIKQDDEYGVFEVVLDGLYKHNSVDIKKMKRALAGGKAVIKDDDVVMALGPSAESATKVFKKASKPRRRW